MAAVGLDKVAGHRTCQKPYQHWAGRASRCAFRARSSWWAGYAVMVGSSAVMLSTKLRNRDGRMAAARSIVLLTAVVALLATAEAEWLPGGQGLEAA